MNRARTPAEKELLICMNLYRDLVKWTRRGKPLRKRTAREQKMPDAIGIAWSRILAARAAVEKERGQPVRWKPMVGLGMMRKRMTIESVNSLSLLLQKYGFSSDTCQAMAKDYRPDDGK